MAQTPEEPTWQTYPATSEPGPISDPPAGAVVPVMPPGVPVPMSQPGLVRAGYSADDPLVLNAGWDEVKREGRWTVPPYLDVRGDLGTARLDFQQASATSQLIQVRVSGGAGTIIVVLPQGWGANLERVTSGMGSVKSQVADEPAPGLPVLVFTGSMGMGTLKVRHPNRWDLRRLRKQERRSQRHR